jgi:hypothetical protein
MKKMMLRGEARQSESPFIMIEVDLQDKLVKFSGWRPYVIDILAYDDPFKASEAIGSGILRRIVNSGGNFPVVIEYEPESGEFQLSHLKVSGLAFLAILIAVLTFYFGYLLK